MTVPPNRYAEPMLHEVELERPDRPSRLTPLSVGVMAIGALLICLSIALVSQQFGNTLFYGMILIIPAGAIFGFGYTISRNSVSHATLIATACGIASPLLLIFLYLIYTIVLSLYKTASS